jgi:hypothetical protein
MTVTPLPKTGNSSKFLVVTKRGQFTLAISSTLRNIIWQLPDDDATQKAAQELAEALVSRHDPEEPFKELYIFAEHNTLPKLDDMVKQLRKYGRLVR